MAKKKEETNEIIETTAVAPLTTPATNGEIEVLRQKLNEVIEYINARA